MKHGENRLMDDHTSLRAGTQCIVAKNTCAPRNEDTEIILKLIGAKLTRFELRADSSICLEFDPEGSITISPKFGMDIVARTATTSKLKPAG